MGKKEVELDKGESVDKITIKFDGCPEIVLAENLDERRNKKSPHISRGPKQGDESFTSH